MDPTHTLELESAWVLLRWLARGWRPLPGPGPRRGFARKAGQWREVDPQGAELTYDVTRMGGACGVHVYSDASVVDLLELFMPICATDLSGLVIAHLGQSLDGRIATRTGASQFITGHEDVVHTHRLRAICDAVVVGARTVSCDDPRLTTRLVTGDHAVRVILDPMRTLSEGYGVFSDGLAPTLLVTSLEQARCGEPSMGQAAVLGVETHEGRFVVNALLRALQARGLRRVFVEGGGVAVSEFLRADALDRLHLTVAPVILGSGVPALELPAIDHLEQALRFSTRHFSLGADVLFDVDTRTASARSDQYNERPNEWRSTAVANAGPSCA